MQAGAVAHDPRGEEPALGHLHEGEYAQHQSDQRTAAAGLEKCQRDGDAQTQDGAEVGHDVEHAQSEADEKAELQADDREPDGEQRAHDQTDEQLSAKERHDDGDELARQENQVVPQVGLEEGQVPTEVFGRIAAGEEEEEKIDGHHGQMGDEADHTERPEAGRFEGGDDLIAEPVDLVLQVGDDLPDRFVFQLVLGDGDPLGVVALRVFDRPAPEGREEGDKIQQLPHQRRRDQEQRPGDRQHEDPVKDDDRAQAAQLESCLQQFHHRPHDQRHDAGHRQRPKHPGKISHQHRKHRDDDDQKGGRYRERDETKRKAYHASLAGRQQRGYGGF